MSGTHRTQKELEAVMKASSPACYCRLPCCNTILLFCFALFRVPEIEPGSLHRRERMVNIVHWASEVAEQVKAPARQG